MPENPLMPIGQVVGAHGINGAVKIHYSDARHGTPIPGDTLRLISPGGSEAIYAVEWARPHKRNHLVGFAGIADRSQAESLAGAQIVIRRSDLPEIEDADTHYWVDLIGLDVYTVEDRYLGQIKAIIPTGGNDVYVVSDEQAETLVPALKNVIIDVNLEANTMRVDLPEGL
jgi:16S rRNA processing protein RimM